MAREIFGPGAAVATSDPRLACVSWLLAEERPAIVHAVESRQREYAAGRWAARQAMAALGFAIQPAPSGPDRAPIWPPGLVGSISHTGEACIAVLARAAEIRSLGVDVEVDAPLEPRLVELVCTPPEVAWLAAQPAAHCGNLATLMFSAKECAYKCQYAVTATMLGFEDLRIELDQAAGEFRAVFLRGIEGFCSPGDSMAGRFRVGGGLVVTGATLPS